MNSANIYDLFKPPEDMEKRIQEGLEFLKGGQFGNAENVFQRLLEQGAENPEVETGCICARYWNNRLEKINKMIKNFERGKFLLNEWEGFKTFLIKKDLDKNSIRTLKVIENTCDFILSLAISDLVDAYQKLNQPDINLLMNIGESFLELSDFKRAIETIEYARVFRKKDPNVLALLADAYYGFGEILRAKVLFREAFFLNPEDIPLEKIRCQMIHNIILEIQNSGIEHIAPWIPVFGMIMGEFNVYKELSEEEVAELVREVEQLEIEYNMKKNIYFLPYLISKYLYLIDYLEKQLEIRYEADKLREKIKSLDPNIFKLYEKFNH